MFIPVVFQKGKGYDFNLRFDEILNQSVGKGKIKALPCGNGKTRTLRVGILKFMDSYSFMGTSIIRMTEIYKLTNKSLYPYEYFKDEQSYYILFGNLTRENFISSLTIKLPYQ